MPPLRAFPLIAFLLTASAQAADITLPGVEGVLNLTSTAQVEVPRDWISVTLSTSREGSDASAVQAQLREALDTALAAARKAARAGQVEVQTGTFSIQPRHAQNGGGMIGWQGRAELILQGRDLAAIAQLAGSLRTLTVAHVAYTLARETRQQAEAEAAAQAIARYRALAADYARQFGFGGYAIREVQVGTSELPPGRPMPMHMMARSVSDALPVEAGQGIVAVTVSGSIQMK